jgi:drug/metabolite transporter (DMT)-like permease
LLPYLILGGAQLAVGAAGLFGRFALVGAGALAVSAARLTIAAIVLHIIALVRRKPSGTTTKTRVVLACSGIALALHFATWIWSLSYTSIAISLLLVATTPLWTALIDFIISRKALSLTTIAAFLIGAVGLSLVVGANATPPPQGGHELLGCALALAGAIAFAIYLMLVRTVRNDENVQTIVTHTYSWAAVILIAAAVVAHQPLPPLANTTSWSGIVAMALVSQLLGHTGMNAALKWFSPNAVAYSTVVEPVIGAALAYVVFHESLTPIAIAGAALALGSIVLVLREERTLAT